MLFVGGFVDGLTGGLFGGLLEGVDTYVFAGEFEIAAARESAAWQTGYVAGAITREIVLLVAAPGCGAGAFVRLLRLGSLYENVSAFTDAAVNIASGEGTGWDYATLVLGGFGILDDLRGLTFCFVPDAWVDLDAGAGMAYAAAGSESPPSVEGDWTLSHKLFGGVVLTCLGVSLGIIAHGSKLDDERKRQALLGEQFFSRLGRAGSARGYDGRPRDFLDLEDEEVPLRDADVDSVWEADDEDWLGLVGESSASERSAPRTSNLPAPAALTVVPAIATRPRTTQCNVAPAGVLKKQSRGSASRARRWSLWLAAASCLFFSFRFFRSAAEHERQALPPALAAVSARSTSPAELRTRKRIADVDLGDRLRGTNPFRHEVDEFEPDPLNWRRIQLVLTKADGTDLQVGLLRPVEWLEAVGARIGGSIFLNLPEMGAVGDALVTSITDCPCIASGNGPVVIGTFRHEVGPEGVVWLLIEGESEPTGVTPNHPYWSADRQDIVAAGELRIGESLLTRAGLRRVVTITPDPNYLGFVYNLETTEHVYSVGEAGALVHNSCALRAYGGPGGGHHVFSKRAFAGLSRYNVNRALAIPQSEIARLRLNHLDAGGITQTQRRLFSELAQSGRPNTLMEHARIAREALVAGGLSQKDAASVVNRALRQLRSWKITAPSDIPWN